MNKHFPPAYHARIDAVKKAARKAKAGVDMDLANRIAATTDSVQLLLDTNGVHHVQPDDPYDIFPILAEISKEQKMPVITAKTANSYYWDGQDHKNFKFISLHIPRTKRLKCVAAMLTLVAKTSAPSNNGRWHSAKPEHIITSEHTPRRYVFLLYGTKGFEMFDMWVEQCKTNPIFRVALSSKPK